MWNKGIEVDPTFATGVCTSEPDLKADWKIRKKYEDKAFNPFSSSDGLQAFNDRLCYGAFVLGRYFLLRGKKEVAFLKWSQVKFVSATENGIPVEYIEVVQHFDKSCQLDLTNTTARSVKD